MPPSEWHPGIRLDPPNKTLQKEERLELKAESSKQNGNMANGHKKPENKLECEHDDPSLQRTGRYIDFKLM